MYVQLGFFSPICITLHLLILNNVYIFVAESLSVQYNNTFWSIDCSE